MPDSRFLELLHAKRAAKREAAVIEKMRAHHVATGGTSANATSASAEPEKANGVAHGSESDPHALHAENLRRRFAARQQRAAASTSDNEPQL